MMTVKIKDIQFIRYFLSHEIDIPSYIHDHILGLNVIIKTTGEPDIVEIKKDEIVYQNPSSVVMFLFHLLYTLLKTHVSNAVQKDKLGLGLLFACRDYVYSDFNAADFPGPPVIVDLEKLPIPHFIVKELVEPFTGNIKLYPVLFMPCRFTDAARIIEQVSTLKSDYSLPVNSVPNTDFPLILVNCNIRNSSAQLSHLVIKSLELSLGVDKTIKIIHNLLLGENDFISTLPSSLISILKTFNGNPRFVVDFLKFFQQGTILTNEENDQIVNIHHAAMKADEYLSSHIKIAAPPDTAISKQWSQWSMLMGLIEKQLEPMRGSMWPASENIKPHEDRLRLMIKDKEKKKRKNQINFEEMLELARNLYDHNAVEPGKLIEVMLKRNRVWKE